jgi:hypothetical protein
MKIAFINHKTMFFFTILAAFFIVAFAGAEDVDEKKGVNKVDSALEKYRVIVNEMVNRPTEDTQAIFKYAEEAEPFFKNPDFTPISKGCPAVESDNLKKKKEVLGKVRKFEETYKDILKDGLVIQTSATYDGDFPSLYSSRQIIIWMLALGVMDFENGDSKAGMARINAAMEFEKGMRDTPILLCVMLSSLVGEFANRAVAQILPKLNEEQLKEIGRLLSSAPDSRMAFVKALKADFTVLSDTKDKWPDKWRQEPGLKDFEKVQGELLDEISAVEAFVKSNGKTEMPKDKPREYWPPTGKMMKKLLEYRQHRIALIKAIDKTLLAKKAGEKAEFSIPYDENRKIVVKGDYGCFVENK